jgi:hypothetical protein
MPFGYFEGVKYDLNDIEQKPTYNRLYHAAWQKKNKDKVNAYLRRYHQEHKDKVKEWNKKYLENISEEQKEVIRKRAAEARWIKYNFDHEYREKKKEEN